MEPISWLHPKDVLLGVFVVNPSFKNGSVEGTSFSNRLEARKRHNEINNALPKLGTIWTVLAW